MRSAFELGGGDIDAARANLETWYNGTMDRVSGWYKRRAQRSLFLVGFLIAVGLNIDAITIVRELSESSALRQAAVAAVENAAATPSGSQPTDPPSLLSMEYEMARNAIRDIGYPVGWDEWWPAPQRTQLTCSARSLCLRGIYVPYAFAVAMGWLATALAVMLGAPFWFDVLNKFMVIRSTVKSYEKSSPEGSEDRRPAQPAVAAPRARGMP